MHELPIAFTHPTQSMETFTQIKTKLFVNLSQQLALARCLVFGSNKKINLKSEV